MKTAKRTAPALSTFGANPVRKTILAGAVSSAFALPMLAQAQVEIYGRANVTVEHQSVKAHGNPATNDFSVNAVVDNSSRVGFRGKEDLGGGLSAFFQVESRVRLDEGTAGFWASRDSFVGLQSGSLGTLRLGRTIGPVYYATYDYISMHNHDTGTSADALLAPAITRRLVERFAGRSPDTAAINRDLSALTPRELEVLRLLAQGLSNAELAAHLHLSEATVKTHVARILAKLSLRDRVQAVVVAYETGLVSPTGLETVSRPADPRRM